MAELAARLKSIDTFDRRGNIIALEDFQGTLSQLRIGSDGDRGTIEQSSQYSRTPDFSLKLQAGGNASDRAWVQKYIALPVLSKVGFEFSFSTTQLGLRIELSIELLTGTTAYYPDIRWSPDTKKISYKDKDGNWQEHADTFDRESGEYRFSTLKLVVDFPNATYERLLWNNQSVDISSLELRHFAAVAVPDLYIFLFVQNTVSLNRRVYIDDIIITQNEP